LRGGEPFHHVRKKKERDRWKRVGMTGGGDPQGQKSRMERNVTHGLQKKKKKKHHGVELLMKRGEGRTGVGE